MPTPSPDPNAYLTIGNSSYGYYVLDDVANVGSITVDYGRQTITEQPRPSVFRAVVTLRADDYSYDFLLNDIVEWYLPNSTGTGRTRVFYGTVTDINASVTYWANGQGLIDYSITAMGPLLRLQRYYVNSALSKQYEGDRIYTLCTATSTPTGGIERPGNYEVAVVSAAYGPALGYAQTAAQSGMGLLYEDGDAVKYETYTTRSGRSAAFTLDGTKVEARNLVAVTSTTNVVNRVSVSYGTSAALSTEYVDSNSQTLYGPITGTRATELHNLSDANTQAQQFLKARAYPFQEITQVIVNLENPNISTANKAALLAVRTGDRCVITLPARLGSIIDGYVEGYTWSYSDRQRVLTLTLSSYAQNVPYTVWYNVDPAATWNTYATATTKWEDIT